MFNVALDFPDELENPVHHQIDLSKNESILQLVLDILIGIENAVGEYDYDDSQRGASFDSCNLLFYCHELEDGNSANSDIISVRFKHFLNDGNRSKTDGSFN